MSDDQTPPEEARRRRRTIAAGETDLARWSREDCSAPTWRARLRRAADYIPAGARVLDLGCGDMALESLLPPGCEYIPSDVMARDARTRVCDVNRGELPDTADADVIVALGVLEYVFDLPAFLARLAAARRPVVTSYCPREWTPGVDRRALGWANDYGLDELAALAAEARLRWRRADRIDEHQILLALDPARESPAHGPGGRVLVLSYNNVGNFGDRLGFHLMASVLPPAAEVTFAHFRPWDVPDDDFDLLVLGIGNSLFAPLLDEALLRLLDRAPRAIGIFGTQYRHAIEARRMDAVLDRLSVWHARYREDILLYGRGRDNVRHLGDWLIAACPMGRGRVESRLAIGDEIWRDQPLDRVIQTIARHRRVFSTRLHPLLCALATADEVGYREQREDGSGRPSGKFRSMLLDVFGRTFPEEEMWPVDRDAVAAYKAGVAAAIPRLRDDIRRLLE